MPSHNISGPTAQESRYRLRLRVWLAVLGAPRPVSGRWITLSVRGRWSDVFGAIGDLADREHLVVIAALGVRRRHGQRVQRRYSAGLIPVARPKTRADCRGGYRPCPWKTCRYNLPTGCLLDDVERGESWGNVHGTHGLKVKGRLADDVSSLATVIDVARVPMHETLTIGRTR